ncbi:MAG: tetratricopeptide repeat protein [Alphaproteobacteria bacterium]|nr:tetratricopeptide repeat protein [Alphaproteobacteria bacterium]
MGASDEAGSLFRQGVALGEQRRTGDAIATLRRALALGPDRAEIHAALGDVLRDGGDAAGAEAAWRRALALRADLAGPLNNLGTALAARGALDEARRLLERAVAAEPDIALLRANLANVLARIGTALNREGRGAEAVAVLERAVALGGEVPPYHVNLGIALRQAGRLEDSIDAFDRALVLRADDPLARWNRGLSLLALGRLPEGWRDYEFRRRLPSAPPAPALPEWDGRAPRRVLVRREQGIGDELLFASCFDDLLATGAEARIECDARLSPLFRRSFPAARIVPVSRPRQGEPDPPCDPGDAEAWIAAGSLPRLFRPSLDAFPARRAYLKADPEAVARWRQLLGPLPSVGLCWRSSRLGGERDSRYARVDDLAPLFALDGFAFVSLQLNLAESEREAAGAALRLAEGLDLRHDVDGTAALISALDRVITVDSWVLSLAGALGVTTRFLAAQRDWATLGSDRVPWLPAVATRFVEPGGWRGAAAEAARDLVEERRRAI